MARRQIRFEKDLSSNLTEYLGQKINIVKRNNSVHFVTLDAVTSTTLSGRNQRLKNIQLPFSEIKEIIIDIPA